MGHQISLSQLLKHIPLVDDISCKEREYLAQASRIVRQPKGGYVLKRGDRATGLYIVMTGRVKIAIPSVHEHDKVIEFFGSGQHFGEAVMFLDHPYLIDAQALEDTLLVHIERDALLNIMTTNPLFMKKMVNGLALRFETLLHDIEVVNLPSAAARVADYLLQYSTLGHEIDLSLPKRTIASKLGLQPETFSRALHQLIDEKCIIVDKAKITIIDSRALKRYAPQLEVTSETLSAEYPNLAQQHKSPPARDWTAPASSKYSEYEF